jgi:hypothetical protein
MALFQTANNTRAATDAATDPVLTPAQAAPRCRRVKPLPCPFQELSLSPHRYCHRAGPGQGPALRGPQL